MKAVDDMYLHRIRIELPPEEVYYIVKLLESWQVKDETVSLTN